MAIYKYKALDNNGKIISGRIEKDSNNDVEKYLRQNNYKIVDVKTMNIFTTDISELGIFRNKISNEDLSIICRQLSFVFSSGMNISKGIEIILNKTKKPLLKNSLQSVFRNILKGIGISESLEREKIFPDLLINMVKVGEMSGTLDRVMTNMADYYEQQSILQKEIKSALIYPAIVSILMIFLVVLSVLFIIPSYTMIFIDNNIELPFFTKLLLDISVFIREYKILLIFMSIVSIVFMITFFKSEKGIYIKNYIIIKFPIINNIYTEISNYRFSLVMSILLESGINIIDAVNISGKVINNKIIDKYFKTIVLEIEQGNSLSDSLNKYSFFDSTLVSMIKIGEETGFISSSIDKVSKYLEFGVNSKMKKINKLIEPLITIFLGLIITFVMLALIMPTISLTTGL